MAWINRISRKASNSREKESGQEQGRIASRLERERERERVKGRERERERERVKHKQALKLAQEIPASGIFLRFLFLCQENSCDS
jgi:hypothetical protein